MWCHSLLWFQALTINQWFWNLCTQIATMGSRLTYGFLTGQLCFDLQVPQTLKDWKWIYISSKLILQYSPLQSCSHSATQARNMRLIRQPLPPTPDPGPDNRTSEVLYRYVPSSLFLLMPGLSPPLWPGRHTIFRFCFQYLESSPYTASRGILSKCTADSSTLGHKTSPGSKCLWNTSGTPRCGTSGVGIILQPPLPLPCASEHVPGHTQPCDFPPPTMLCVDSLSLFAWLPLSRLFSPCLPRSHTASGLIPSLPLRSSSGATSSRWPADPSPAGHGTLPPRSDDVLYLPLCLTYCIITITFMASSPLRGYKLQRAEIILSISFYLSYLASHTHLFHLCFPRKLKKKKLFFKKIWTVDNPTTSSYHSLETICKTYLLQFLNWRII